MLSKEEISKLKINVFNQCDDETIRLVAEMLKHTEQLESDKQKLIEKLEERIKSVDKCHDELIKPYYDEKLNIINTSFMSKKEKEEFINKRNCLLVQKHCYEEILEILKGENHDNQARIYRDYK